MLDLSPHCKITQAVEVTDELYQACQRLVPQLTDNNPPPTREQLAQMLASPTTFLYLASHQDFGDEIIGMATLILYRVPTGLRGYIEDVVVDEKARGKRIGEVLSHACLERAEQAVAHDVASRCPAGNADLQPWQGCCQPAVSAHGLRAAQDKCVPVWF